MSFQATSFSASVNWPTPAHPLSESLLRDVWGHKYDVGSNVVDVVVRAIRKKLGPHAMIETVSGFAIASGKWQETTPHDGSRLNATLVLPIRDTCAMAHRCASTGSSPAVKGWRMPGIPLKVGDSLDPF